MRTVATALAVAAVVLAPVGASAGVTPACQQAVATGGAKFAKAALKIGQRCAIRGGAGAVSCQPSAGAGVGCSGAGVGCSGAGAGAGVGWAAACVGAVSLTGLFDFGWISPLLGVVPSGAAWLLAHEELKAVSAGVIATEAREKSRHAYWLGLMALIMCVTVIAAMIYRGLHFLPDV